MNKRISRNGINRIARSYHDMLHGDGITVVKLSRRTPEDGFDAMVSLLANMLADDNESFDRDRFYSVIYRESDKGGTSSM